MLSTALYPGQGAPHWGVASRTGTGVGNDSTVHGPGNALRWRGNFLVGALLVLRL